MLIIGFFLARISDSDVRVAPQSTNHSPHGWVLMKEPPNLARKQPGFPGFP